MSKGRGYRFVLNLHLVVCFSGLVALPAQAANHYVRAGASGSANGADWTNAYTTLPSTLTRGDTYYVADGTYPGRTFNTATSGTSLITIKKATIADHGISTGWTDAYGDGQASFTSQLVFTTGYWLVDGQVGGGPATTKAGWTTGYGFKATETSSNPVLFVKGGAGNVSFRHIEVQGHGDGIDGGIGNDAFQVYTPPVLLPCRMPTSTTPAAACSISAQAA